MLGFSAKTCEHYPRVSQGMVEQCGSLRFIGFLSWRLHVGLRWALGAHDGFPFWILLLVSDVGSNGGSSARSSKAEPAAVKKATGPGQIGAVHI